MVRRVASVKRALQAHIERSGASGPDLYGLLVYAAARRSSWRTIPPHLVAPLSELLAEESIQEGTLEELEEAHEQLDKEEKVSGGESKQTRKAWALASAHCLRCALLKHELLLRHRAARKNSRSLSQRPRVPLADGAREGDSASTPRSSPPSAGKAREASAEPPPSPPRVVRRYYSHHRQSVCAQLSTGEIRTATEHRADEGKMSGLIEPFGWLTTSEPAEPPAQTGPSCLVPWCPRLLPEREARAYKRGAWYYEHCVKRSCVVARCVEGGKGSSRTFSYAKYGGAEGAASAADDFCEEREYEGVA